MPISASDETTDSNGSILEQDTIDEYPHLVEIGEFAQGSEFSFDSEFEFGLDLILEALHRTTKSEHG